VLAFVLALGVGIAPAFAQQAKSAQSTTVVNLNTATAAQLQELPGRARTAERITEHSEKNGGFKKIEAHERERYRREELEAEGPDHRHPTQRRAPMYLGARSRFARPAPDAQELLTCLGGRHPGRDLRAVFPPTTFGRAAARMCRVF
jgi:hypothetical protein